MKDFDVIIIGSGAGGLISAGILASNGLKPLVIEAHRNPGGYMTSFRRKGYIFDSAVDCISGIGPEGIISGVLSSLGVDKDIGFARIDPIRSSMFPDFTVDVDADIDLYIERLIKLFPSESKGIKSFFKAARGVYDSVRSGINMMAGRGDGAGSMSPDMFRLRNNTYESLLKEHVHDYRLRSVLSDRCPFAGLPPSKIAALPMIMMIMSYFIQGAYRPVGGFQRLSDALVKGINEKGGRVVLDSRVKKILLEGRSCRGVICHNGEEYSAAHVISNADFTHTFRDLLGGEYLPLAAKMLEHPGISTSFFIVYAGMKGEFSGHSSTGYYSSYDLSDMMAPGAAFREDGTLGITVASVEDRLRAPEGCHTVVLHEMVEAETNNQDKKKCTEMTIRKAEKVIPGLMDSIEVLDSATPMTLQRYTGNLNGSAFGWRQVPGPVMPAHGLNNLYIAGHWGEMGGGVLAAAYAGLQAAAHILEQEGIPVVV